MVNLSQCIENMLSKYLKSGLFNYSEQIMADPYLIKKDIVKLMDDLIPDISITEMEKSLSDIMQSMEMVSFEISNLKASVCQLKLGGKSQKKYAPVCT